MIRLFLRGVLSEGDPRFEQAALTAELLTDATYRAIAAGDSAYPAVHAGVLAAGVGTDTRPLLVVSPDFAQRPLGFSGPGQAFTEMRDQLVAAFNGLQLALPDDLNWNAIVESASVNVEQPASARWGVADKATAQMRKIGTFGAAVLRANGERALLTAGHVAANNNTVVTPRGERGTAVFSEDPFSYRDRDVPCADVAVVSFATTGGAPGLPKTLSKITGYDMARANDTVDVHYQNGRRSSATVSGYVDYQRLTDGTQKSKALAGCCIRLNPAITQAGDSGAAVTLQGKGTVVGHVTGEAGGRTIVQSIAWQLAAIRCKLAVIP